MAEEEQQQQQAVLQAGKDPTAQGDPPKVTFSSEKESDAADPMTTDVERGRTKSLQATHEGANETPSRSPRRSKHQNLVPNTSGRIVFGVLFTVLLVLFGWPFLLTNIRSRRSFVLWGCFRWRRSGWGLCRQSSSSLEWSTSLGSQRRPHCSACVERYCKA